MSDEQVAAIAQTAVVRPGDTLILRVADRTPMEYIDRCGKAIREKLPDVKVFFVGGVEEMAVYRPEAEGVTIRPDDVVAVHPNSSELLMVRAEDIAVVRLEAGE